MLVLCFISKTWKTAAQQQMKNSELTLQLGEATKIIELIPHFDYVDLIPT